MKGRPKLSWCCPCDYVILDLITPITATNATITMFPQTSTQARKFKKNVNTPMEMSNLGFYLQEMRIDCFWTIFL